MSALLNTSGSNQTTEVWKTIEFEDDADADVDEEGGTIMPSRVEIAVRERLEADYGHYTWPSSQVLAEYIWRNRQRFKGTNIIELGAGTAIPGVLAAKIGARVVLTEYDEEGDYARALITNLVAICKANNLKPIVIDAKGRAVGDDLADPSSVVVMGLTWGVFKQSFYDYLSTQDFDYIIAADCFYKRSDFDDVLATVRALFDTSASFSPSSSDNQMVKQPKFITTYHDRSAHRSLLSLLVKWKLKGEEIAVEDFFPEKKLASLGTDIKLFVISNAETT